MGRGQVRRGVGALAAASLVLGFSATAAAAASPPTPGGSLVAERGMAPPSPRLYGAAVQGGAPSATPVHMTVYFSSPDQAGLAALANQVSTPGSSSFRQFLTVAGFRDRFAPPASTVASVNSYLRSQGMHVGALDANGLEESVTATAGQTAAALHVPAQRVRTREGADVVGITSAPRLPASIAGDVAYIDGLAPWVKPVSNARLSKRQARTGPAPAAAMTPAATMSSAAAVGECSQLSSGSAQGYGMDPNQLSSDLQLGGFYSGGNTGAGKTVALIEYSSTDTTGVNLYASCLGLHPSITYNNDSADPPGTPMVEADIDVEDVMGLAPAASIVVEQAGNGPFNNTLDPFQMAISPPAGKPLPDVISSSWGMCEPYSYESANGSSFSTFNGYLTAEVNLLAEAALQGQTVLVASGDDGSAGCYSEAQGDTTYQNGLYVSSPSSDPLATAVGGTAAGAAAGTQVVWNAADAGCANPCDIGRGSGGGSGGGLSAAWQQPSYQPANPTLQAGCTNTGSGGCREVPDVSADAGDAYLLLCNTAAPDCNPNQPAGTYFIGIGGTSLAAPDWAAAVALADNNCGGDIGFLNPTLYQNTATGHPVVGQVTSGDNDSHQVNSGKYPAYVTGAQNLATGLGFLGGVNLAGGALCQAYSSAPPSPGPYTPLSPTRICDTRALSYLSGSAAQCDGRTVRSGRAITISVGGAFGVPSNASAVVLNVTAVHPSTGGYLTAYPAGASRPTASNLNFSAGQVVPNLVEVGLGTLGRVTIYSFATTDVVVDLEGYVSATAPAGAGSGLYNALPAPTRVCDTRPLTYLTGPAAQCNGRTMSAGSVLPVALAGSFGVPAGASAVVLNVTAVQPSAGGYLTVYPDGTSRPTASNVNMSQGITVPNRVIVPLGSDGAIDVYASASTNVIVDISGWYSAPGGSGAQFQSESAPVRICDTRSSSKLSGAAGQCNNHPLGQGGTITVTAAGAFGVPGGATAVVLNVTGVAPTAGTYLTVYPGGTRPNSSDLNINQGSVAANLVVATLSPTGAFTVYNYAGSTNVVVDVAGWYQ